MPTTRRRRLSDFIKAFARTNLSNLEGVEKKKEDTRVALATSTTADINLFHADGPCAIKRIIFVPELAIASSGTNYWTLTFTNRGTNGGGSTSLGTFTTNGNALTAYDAKAVYNPATETVVDDDTVVSVAAAETGAATDFQGQFIVEFVSLLD